MITTRRGHTDYRKGSHHKQPGSDALARIEASPFPGVARFPVLETRFYRPSGKGSGLMFSHHTLDRPSSGRVNCPQETVTGLSRPWRGSPRHQTPGTLAPRSAPRALANRGRPAHRVQELYVLAYLAPRDLP